jgi:multidrug efflux pump subunit AcrA (membrane-fusion protein)
MVVAGALALPACGASSESEDGGSQAPARLEAVAGTDLERVVLTTEAADRIDLQTAPVVVGGAPGQVAIPHAAVFYGLSGETWTYASPEALTYVRTPITVDHIDGDLAYLTDGPEPGAEVVTVGAAELYGVETGIGD